jgi:integrase
MKLPKNVYRKKGDVLFFQKDYPTKLRHLIQTKTFSYSLGLKVGATDKEVSIARTRALEVFERELKYVTESDPDAFDVDEHQQKAKDILRKAGLRAGQLSTKVIDNRVGDITSLIAEELIPEIMDIQTADEIYRQEQGEYAQRPYSPVEQSQFVAYKMLLEAESDKPKTLGSLYQEYKQTSLKGKDKRDLNRINTRWNRFISLLPTTLISGKTIDDIHHALDKYVIERTESVKGQTIDRELTSVVSCLRWANRKYRFKWIIERPDIKFDKVNPKQVLTREHQRMVAEGSLKYKRPEVACIALLQLQGAMMPSEVKRLTQESILLEGNYPLLIIKGDTKTNARKRVIPIILHRDFIQQHIDDSVKWLNSCTDTAHSHALKNLLSDLTGCKDKYTSHCFRHTFKANREASGADIVHSATIAGWSAKGAGVSEHLLNYGAEGLAQSEVVAALHNTSKKIHQHLVPRELNVVKLMA